MKTFFFTAVLISFIAAFCANDALAETEYFAIFMDGKKIGHAIHERVVADGKVVTSEKVSMTLARTGIPILFNATETCIETAAGVPLAFESVQDMSIMKMAATGTIDSSGMVDMTSLSMAGEQKKQLQMARRCGYGRGPSFA